MITQKPDETRIQYLMRVLYTYMYENGSFEIEYDDCTCDGVFLADEIKIELESLGLLEGK